MALRICLFLLTLPFLSFSQQGLQFSQYMLDRYQVNPAFAGLDYSLSVTADIRSQYSELTGNPNSQSINAHLPFYKWNAALGMQISNERLGAFRRTGVHASYSYVLENNNFILAGAAKLGLVSTSLDGDQLITPDGNYEGSTINHNDPLLTSGILNGATPDLGLGIYFRSKHFEGGLSIDGLWSNAYKLNEIAVSKNIEATFYGQSSLSYGGTYKFIPSILLRTDAKELQADLNLLVKYNGNVFGGIGLRGYNATSFDAISLIGGLKLNTNYTLSYSYDFGISDLRHFNEGSHEIMLNYNLNKLIGVGSDPKIIYNPRHL